MGLAGPFRDLSDGNTPARLGKFPFIPEIGRGNISAFQ